MGYDFDRVDGDCPKMPTVKPAATSDEPRVVADAVCPICFRAIENPVIMAEKPDGEGRLLRKYFGYCSHCGAGQVVVQFAREDRWVIHKYRPAVVLGVANIIGISDDWKLMSELPKAKSEDGGLKTEDGEVTLMDSLREMHKAMKSCCVVIESLLRNEAAKRGQAIDD